MFDFLDGFEKRMEIVGVVESIVNRKNKNLEMERMFDNSDFVNLVFSVLLFIMEKSLSEDYNCDSKHIMEFLAVLLPEYYSLSLDQNQLMDLTNYIIKNILQNEGVAYHFRSLDYANKTKKDINIRLIADHAKETDRGDIIIYSLTNQGYDFLFKTKEVDQMLQLTIEELKLKELLKRKNFKKAYDQSVHLIQLVRQKKREIQVLMIKIRENIYNVDIDEFEKLIDSTYDLLDEEYDLMNEIMDITVKAEDKIRQDYEISQKLDESLKKSQADIKRINNNIKTTLSEQKDLILSRQSLSKIYVDIIGDSFIYNLDKRFDIEDVILKQMESHVDMTEKFWQLINPLFMPKVFKNMNIRGIYEPQGMIKLEEEDRVGYIEEESLSEDQEKKKIERVNEIYVEIIDYLLSFTMQQGDECRLEDMINALKKEAWRFEKLLEDRLFFTTLLKLYDIGVIDIERWQSSGTRVVMNLSEEFNLEYCLYQLKENKEYFSNISRFYVFKEDENLIEVEINRNVKDDISIIEKIEISKFMMKVERNDGQRKDWSSDI